MNIGFSPAVYEHAAFLIGRRPWDVSRNGDLIYQGHLKAYEMYELPFMVLGIDIYNLEAEAYGATVHDPGGDGIPAITQPICAGIDEVFRLQSFDPMRDGRIPMILECGRKLLANTPPNVVRIPVSGPFSIASNLLGAEELLMAVQTCPREVGKLLHHLVEGQVRFCRAIVNAGLGIALFESAAAPPLLSPQQFELVELPAITGLISRLKDELGVVAPLILGGDTTLILEAIVSTGTKYVICPAETNREEFMAKASHYPDVTVRINLQTGTLVHGPIDTLLREVDEVIALATLVPNRVLLGSGAVPYETPPEHILAIKRYVG